MGAIYYGIPTKLADDLRKRHGLKTFVESGLGQGTTALWAESLFSPVISIESNSEEITKFRNSYPKSNVRVVKGDSAIEMIRIVNGLESPALFWLDGHSDDYTPILAELAAINLSQFQNVIMIDDWRMFGTFIAWPSKERVITFATINKAHRVYDVDDVLIVEP